MFFEDLSPYSFGLPRSIADVLNVGWLDASHSWPTGSVPHTFSERLRRCAVECSVNKIRGYHECNICAHGEERQSIVVDGKVFWLGAAELWVPHSEGKVFAAPDLIVHYVEVHGYCPPPPFILAVEGCSPAWDAERVFEEHMSLIFK